MTANTIGHRSRELLLDSQRRVLERITSGAPLQEILLTLVRLIEEQADGLRCAILLADPTRQRLTFAAAPSIPEDYKSGIEPYLRIAPNMGSCGTAAFLRKPVYTEDTATDPLWDNCHGFAVRNGLRAIWSTPILSDDNDVLGTFAMYYGEPRLPAAGDVQLIDMATQVARLAIERKRAEETLRESEARFRQITENIHEVFWMTTADMDELLYVSPAYENIWGRSLESLRQQPRSFFDAIHDEDRADAVNNIETRRHTGFDIEYRIVRPDGTMRWIRDRGFPVKDASGKVYRIAGIAEDITTRKQLDEALRQSEFDLAEAQRVARLGSWTFDIATGIIRGSEELYHIFDVEKTALGGTYETFLSRIHRDDQSRVLEAHAEARSSGKHYEHEYRLATRSGQLKHIRSVGYTRRDSTGAIVGFFGTVQDITESKHAENALRASAHELQALSRRLVELQESERKELARELHDRVGQSLTAISINLAVLRGTLSQHDAVIRSRLDDSAALLESTTQAIENVTSDLRPPMLDDHGLRPALEWYASQFSARAGIVVSVRTSGPDERIAADLEIALFRIAQEALNNVAKHACATSVVIALECTRSEYVLSVADDGVGLRHVEDLVERPRPGLGIVTMMERAQAIGGHFEIESLPESGTRLTVRIPK